MARSREARMIDRRGALVVLRRPSGTIPPTFTDVVLKAFWRETGSDTLTGSAAQRTFSIIVAADALAETAFPPDGPAKGDHVIIKPTIVGGAWTGGGQTLTVSSPGERPSGWWMEAKG
ncbi:hypothetical protein [Azospirillum picis]|uniref:Uncharacterized protein n=1 Tax=Azospirillum picis TaxID=488438 RepID=A0ABU0MRX3_9PROT|nr:hypothetical protein [Azospirillum picis]MBP2302525.1 hypothetical protein [Azospirillum picis]MDQ0536233.1 hypothetical protein [Azospirillum picis]